mgnify:CR=1 FL=1
MDESKFVSVDQAKKVLTRIGVAMAMYILMGVAGGVILCYKFAQGDAAIAAARASSVELSDEAEDLFVDAWHMAYDAKKTARAAEREVQKMSTTVDSIGKDLETSKEFGELWNDVLLDIQVQHRVEINELTDKVDAMKREMAKPGDVVIRLNWSGLPEVTLCGPPAIEPTGRLYGDFGGGTIEFSEGTSVVTVDCVDRSSNFLHLIGSTMNGKISFESVPKTDDLTGTVDTSQYITLGSGFNIYPAAGTRTSHIESHAEQIPHFSACQIDGVCGK